jgi:hypothetical protein
LQYAHIRLFTSKQAAATVHNDMDGQNIVDTQIANGFAL